MTGKFNPIDVLASVAQVIASCLPDLRSVALIGSAAQQLITRGVLQSARDCDLVVLLERAFQFGDVVLDVKDIERVVNETPSLPRKVKCTYNGLGDQLDDDRFLTVDIIPHSTRLLTPNDAFTIIDIVHRGYIIITGEDRYAPFSSVDIHPTLCLQRILEIERYINREHLDNKTHSRYLAKSAILLSSLLVVDHMPSLDKGEIVRTVVSEHPSLATDLSTAYDIYRGVEFQRSELLTIHSQILVYTKNILNKRIMRQTNSLH